MRLHRFYISEEIGNRREIKISSPDMLHQMKKVFRLGAGDRVILFDGSHRDHIARMVEPEKNERSGASPGATFLIEETVESRWFPTREVVLCAAIVKKDKFEWIVEKATELGASKIIPVLSERSEKKSLNMERIRKIAVEASEQSGRGDVPIIERVMTLREVLGDGSAHSFTLPQNIVRVAFHTEGAQSREMLRDKDVAIFVGPEGGWSDEEVALFHDKDINVFSMGPQILRAETAAVAALARVTL